jgi:hypothetical protein
MATVIFLCIIMKHWGKDIDSNEVTCLEYSQFKYHKTPHRHQLDCHKHHIDNSSIAKNPLWTVVPAPQTHMYRSHNTTNPLWTTDPLPQAPYGQYFQCHKTILKTVPVHIPLMDSISSTTNPYGRQSQCQNAIWTGLKSMSGLIRAKSFSSRLWHGQTQGYDMLVLYIR